MKKSIVVTVLVLVLSLVMSACGSAPQNGSEPQKKGKISLQFSIFFLIIKLSSAFLLGG